MIQEYLNSESFKLNSKVGYYFIAIVIACLVSAIFSPGMFSPDSFGQIDQGLREKYSTLHPVIMAIIMAKLYPIFGVGGMLIFQQLCYWIGVFLIVDHLYKKNIVLALLLGFFPPIFTVTIDVWKDVSNLAALILSLGAFIQYYQYKNQNHRKPIVRLFWLGLALLSLLFANVIRANTILFTPLLFFAGAMLIFHNIHRWLKSLGLTLVFIAISVALSYGIDFYTQAAKEYRVQITTVHDLAGICKNAKIDCPIPVGVKIVDQQRINEWQDGYEPRSTNKICFIQKIITCRTFDPNDERNAVKQWLSYVKKYPQSYLKHRYEFSKYLLGVTSHYYMYSYQLNEKQNNPDFHLSMLGKKCSDYLFSLASFFDRIWFYKPIVYIFLSSALICAFLFQWCRKKGIKTQKGSRIHSNNSVVDREQPHLNTKEQNSVFINSRETQFKYWIYFALYSSLMVNALSLTLISPSAEYRYLLWTVEASILLFLFWGSDLSYLFKLKENQIVDIEGQS